MTSLANIVSFLAGSGFTLVAIYFKHILDTRAEERKRTRENIDAIYTLTNQLRSWFQVQLWEICEAAGVNIVYGEYPYEVLLWHFTNPTEELNCSIGELINRLTVLAAQHASASNQEMLYVLGAVSTMHAIQNALKTSSIKILVERLIKELYLEEERVQQSTTTRDTKQRKYLKQSKRLNTREEALLKLAAHITVMRENILDECKIYEKLNEGNNNDEVETQMKKLVKEFTTYAWYDFDYHYTQFLFSLKK